MGRKGKLILALVSVLLILSLVFVGCAKPATSPTPVPSPKPSVTPTAAPSPGAPTPTAKPSPSPTAAAITLPIEEQQLPRQVVFKAIKGGVSETQATSWASLIQKYTVMSSTITLGYGIKDIAKSLETGEGDLFMFSTPNPRVAYFGQPPLDKAYRIWATNCGAGKASSFLGVYTTPKTGIVKMADLKGKVFAARSPAMFYIEPVAEALMKANGLTKEDAKRWVTFTAGADGARELIEGRVDAYIYIANPNTREVAETVGLYVVPMTPTEQEAANKAEPGFLPAMLPADFVGNKTEVPVVAAPAAFWIRPELTTLTVYAMVKAFYEHLPEFQAGHVGNTGYTKDVALRQWMIPYHPGAVMYFKEIGLWTKEHDQKQKELLLKDKERFGPLPHEAVFKALGVL